MKSKYLVFSMFCCLTSWSQNLSLDMDLRQRGEYRHGFSTLFPDDADPAFFVRQRARLNIAYNSERLNVFVAFQDVSTWGDTRQILPQDSNDSFSLFQAWAQYYLNEKWSLKLGRQVISYDDERIFGGLDWAMQGRFHDAALLKYEQNKLKLDIGLAFSQEGEPLRGTEYYVKGFFTYKSLQLFHLENSWEKLSGSLLFANTIFQDYDETDAADGSYSLQTTGFYLNYIPGKFKLSGFSYFQFGKAYPLNASISAYDLNLEASYSFSKTRIALGVEALSGTDQGSDDNNSFFPLYGTNHKFNGFMDYFYVGNHANSVGLNDIYGKLQFNFAKSNLTLAAHYFASNANLIDDASQYLGTEIDLVYSGTLIKNVSYNFGYSHMFASDSMSLIKGGITNKNTNNWAWVQLKFSPNLFKHTFLDNN